MPLRMLNIVAFSVGSTLSCHLRSQTEINPTKYGSLRRSKDKVSEPVTPSPISNCTSVFVVSLVWVNMSVFSIEDELWRVKLPARNFKVALQWQLGEVGARIQCGKLVSESVLVEGSVARRWSVQAIPCLWQFKSSLLSHPTSQQVSKLPKFVRKEL